MRWKKVTMVGVGLLGGSLGMALKQRRLADTVFGFVRRRESASESLSLGAVDQAGTDLAEAVRDADLIVLCTPIAQMRPLAEKMMPSVKAGVLVTDVGSVKAGVVDALGPLVERAGGTFIGSHPMAGSEKMGVASARADLFERAVCLLTPSPGSPPEHTQRLTSFWHSVGGLPMTLDPKLHDLFVGRSSHLPHLLAAELAHYVLNPELPPEQAAVCANGFRDTTRVASGSPEMWRDISLANRDNLARELKGLVNRLNHLRGALERGDAPALQDFFEEAKRRRDQWREQNASPSRE